ncbi:hypothetical protein Mapa_010259 [Marchantia paleacea]|nr:hypothetical protein Mapa_010259 [Marchantia paleacea]
MAAAMSVQSLHVLSGSLLSRECYESPCSGTRNSASFGSVDVYSWGCRNKGLAKEIKWQPSSGGLRLEERDRQVRRSCQRKVQACAIQENHSLSALAITDDVALDQSCSSQDNNRGENEEIELNYTTVREIVENLQDAPFLQYVYNTNQGGKPERQRLSNEFLDKPESWGSVRNCLLEAAPDGIILVQRLDRNDPSECCLIEKSGGTCGFKLARGDQDVADQDYWGVLVHGCKVRCNACYLLRTTRQPSSTGFTTYFMLIRAECFGPSIENQFQRALLV